MKVDVINGGKKTGYDTKVRYNVSVAHGGSHYRRSSGFGP